MQSFLELGVSARVAQALAERDIHAPFRIQGLVLPDALAGRDVLAKSPTGSGKTLAFAVPIVERLRRERRRARPGSSSSRRASWPPRWPPSSARSPPPATSASPRSTAASRSARRRRPRATRTSSSRRRAASRTSSSGRIVSLDGVSMLVLDEADRMLDMGFQPQVDRIVARLPKQRQTMFFSATLDGKVGELARAYTQNPAPLRGAADHDQEQGEIDHRFVPVTADNKVENLAELLARGARARARLRPHQARRRPARPEARPPRRLGGRDARRHEPEPARARAEALRERHGQDARRHRRRRARPRPRRHHPRHQLRPARGAHRLRPPRRPHRPRGQATASGVTLVLPEQQAEVSHVARMLGHTEQFASEGMKVAPPRLVYTSKRRDSSGAPPGPAARSSSVFLRLQPRCD